MAALWARAASSVRISTTVQPLSVQATMERSLVVAVRGCAEAPAASTPRAPTRLERIAIQLKGSMGAP